MDLQHSLSDLKSNIQNPKKISEIIDSFVKTVFSDCNRLCKEPNILNLLLNYDNGYREINGVGLLRIRWNDNSLRFPNYPNIMMLVPYLTETLDGVEDATKKIEQFLIENFRWRKHANLTCIPKGGKEAKITLNMLYGIGATYTEEKVILLNSSQILTLLSKSIIAMITESEVYIIEYGLFFHIQIDLIIEDNWENYAYKARVITLQTKYGDIAHFSESHKRIFLNPRTIVNESDVIHIAIHHELVHTFDRYLIKIRHEVPFIAGLYERCKIEGLPLFVELIRSEKWLENYVNVHKRLLREGKIRNLESMQIGELSGLYIISGLMYIQLFLLLIHQKNKVILELSEADIKRAIKEYGETGNLLYRICNKLEPRRFVGYYKNMFYSHAEVSKRFFDFYENYLRNIHDVEVLMHEGTDEEIEQYRLNISKKSKMTKFLGVFKSFFGKFRKH